MELNNLKDIELENPAEDLGIYDLKKFRSKSQQLNEHTSWDFFGVRKGMLKLNS